MRRWLRQSITPTLCLCAVAYFAYHLVQGQRGIIALNKLSKEISVAELALAQADAEHRRLLAQVALLKPQSLDPDLLDERARAILGLVHPDELVIYDDSD